MAGQGHTIPEHRARHTTAAVVLSCLILIVFSAPAVRADYLIALPDGNTIRTGGYRIQGNMLYFAEDREPVNAYEVQSIRGEDLSRDQVKERQEAMQELRVLVTDLLEREGAVLKGQEDLMKEITEREAMTGTVLEPKERKAFRSGLTSRMQEMRDLKASWRGIRLPDYSLLLMRDIKMLQLMSLQASVEHASKYVESGDPTNREYAWEHLRQAFSFQESFREAIPWE